MRAEGTFTVHDFTPAAVEPTISVQTGVDVGVATMEKRYDGQLSGRSATLFTSAFDQAIGVGSYVAVESFEGELNGISGTFNFTHAASTGGKDRHDESFVIVPSSGTGELSGIAGTGGISVDHDGVHRIWFDYTLG